MSVSMTTSLTRSVLVLSALLLIPAAYAQTPPPEPDPQQTPQSASGNPDGQIVDGPAPETRTPAQLKDDSWSLLSSALGDVKHPDLRIQGIAALGLLGNNPRSLQMIEEAMTDRDVDVRTAAVLAAGQTRATAIIPALHRMLNDKEPQVVYAAALSLWKENDCTGQDILVAVVDGERRASATLINGTEHTMSKDLHSPSTLAKIGALQGASMLLGPFGIGITAYEYIKKNGGDSARVQAIDQLSEDRSDGLRKVFVAALGDKDPSVRAAAAKAACLYKVPEVAAAIAKLFVDTKPPVRLTAAAAYLISTGASPASPNPNARKTVARHK